MISVNPANVTFNLTLNLTEPTGQAYEPVTVDGLICMNHYLPTLLFDFRNDRPAGIGLQSLAETGNQSALIDEIDALKAAGYVGNYFQGPASIAFPNVTTMQVQVSEVFPLLSCAARLTPGPDWFTGIADINLLDWDLFANVTRDGRPPSDTFYQEVISVLPGFDAGTLSYAGVPESGNVTLLPDEFGYATLAKSSY
ncbi:Spondin domain-containing protein [Plasmodiophora brassicae]|nr:hypothetical protein PBRA_001003 [Plasmodiophora brassicae]